MVLLSQDHLERRYADWLYFLFGRVDEATDGWRMKWEFDDPDRLAAGHFTRTLTDCGRDLAYYSDWQLAIGLEAMFFKSPAQQVSLLMATAPNADTAMGACTALKSLYSDCLAVRTPRILAHLGQTEGNPLERLTYMLWDTSPLISLAGRKETRAPFLSVLEGVLYIDNPACVESALHGLSHSRATGLGAATRNAEVGSIIDRFLAKRTQLDPALRDYAIRAKDGSIHMICAHHE